MSDKLPSLAAGVFLFFCAYGLARNALCHRGCLSGRYVMYGELLCTQYILYHFIHIT